MERLQAMLGRERDVDDVARTLYGFASDLRMPVVGAMHVTCADESERECVEAFQRNVSDYLLPHLKFGERSHFRLANLGGRYEPGALAIAADHYASAGKGQGQLLMLVKVNAHVSVEPGADGPRFGRMRRYDEESIYCGALHALMDGSKLPFAEELGGIFRSSGRDRLAMLRDPERVSPRERGLFAAVANACLQARRVVADIGEARPPTPTLFVVLACVTLNRQRRDHEILCGIHRIDLREAEVQVDYKGLDDDPSAYRLSDERGSLVIRDAV